MAKKADIAGIAIVLGPEAAIRLLLDPEQASGSAAAPEKKEEK